MTVVGRQTAYRMRHCCARRIDKTGGRRKLLRISTRWAERHPQGVCRIRKAAEPPTAAQQRIIEAEANRLAVLTRQRRAQAFPFRRHKSRSSPKLPIKALSLGGCKGGYSLSEKENIPLLRTPARCGSSPLPFRAKRKNKTYLAAGSIFRSYSPSSTARRSLTLPSSASSIVRISASRSRLSVPPRGR